MSQLLDVLTNPRYILENSSSGLFKMENVNCLKCETDCCNSVIDLIISTQKPYQPFDSLILHINSAWLCQ